MFVYASIDARSADASATPVLAVPTTAVANLQGQTVVFVQVDERSFEAREVVLGETHAEWAEVSSGLVEGEPIAVSGVFTLKSELLKGGLEGHAH